MIAYSLTEQEARELRRYYGAMKAAMEYLHESGLMQTDFTSTVEADAWRKIRTLSELGSQTIEAALQREARQRKSNQPAGETGAPIDRPAPPGDRTTAHPSE